MKLNRHLLDQKWNNFLVEHFARKLPKGHQKNRTKVTTGFETLKSLLENHAFVQILMYTSIYSSNTLLNSSINHMSTYSTNHLALFRLNPQSYIVKNQSMHNI